MFRAVDESWRVLGDCLYDIPEVVMPMAVTLVPSLVGRA